MASILDEIFAAKRIEVRAQRAATPPAAIAAAAVRAAPPRPLLDALRVHRPAIIAEVKRASPSKGDILPGLDPAAVARDYLAGGAAAISVLTDRHFKGSLDDLRTVRRRGRSANSTQGLHLRPLPALRGPRGWCGLHPADRRDAQGRRVAFAGGAGARMKMAALIEVHDAAEFTLARKVDAELIGVNNRDLHTFKTDLATTESLLRGYDGDALIVAESGIETPADIRRLDAAGARAF